VLSPDALKSFAVRWQTSLANVAREYVQNLFLSVLYRQAESESLAFKGGTALRLIYKSPRFSEDLDFTGGLKPYHLGKLFSKTREGVARESVSLDVVESKPTSGGFLALYRYRLHGEEMGLELNISTRRRVRTRPVMVTSPLVPAYQCLVLPSGDMVEEKIQALLFRKKPRDFYDLYFILRERLGLEAVLLHKDRLLDLVRAQDARSLQRELRLFLPAGHQNLYSHLPQALKQELDRL
jgi:predicted nucleotidyltransferase component of viral defense system